MDDCRWYLHGMCGMNLDSARVFDCTAANLKERKVIESKFEKSNWWETGCPYPRIGKDGR